MPDEPTRASEYKSEQVDLVRATCLYVATKLGDLMDEVVVVGGLVPSLLIGQGTLPEGTSAHVGTVDLDVGLELALLDEGRYRTLTERLRDAGFTQDQTEEGRPTRQRWRVTGLGSVTVDFLIPPSLATDQGGTLRDIVLRDDFLDHDGVGPRRVAEFLQGGHNAEVQADVVGFVAALLDAVRGR